MTDFENMSASVEGKLHAQRHVLAALVAAVIEPRPDTLDRLRSLVTRDAIASDQAEDPGVDPDPAFAIEASEAEELRRIAWEVNRICGTTGPE